MRFEDALPIIEGKIYAWAEWRQRSDRPTASISRVYEDQIGRVETPDHTSPQERWVMWQARIYEAGIIEGALKRCSQEQRELVFRRYVQRETWGEIAQGLHMGERTVYLVRDQVLAIVACALGVWEEG